MNRKNAEVSEINRLIAQFLDDVAKDFSEYSNIKPQSVPIVYRQIDVGVQKERYSYGSPKDTSKEKEPLIDIIENESSIVVITEVQGIRKKELRLTGSSKEILIRANSQSRSIALPKQVDPKSAAASFRNGILEITLNKSTYSNSLVTISVND